ncbi:MAG: hypothetical protein AAF580_02190 [Pseudomonadota bacterium]
MDEVHEPDVVRGPGPQPDRRRIVVVEALTLLVAVRQQQPFLAPDALDLLMVGPPVFGAKQFIDFAVAVAPILLGDPD